MNCQNNASLNKWYKKKGEIPNNNRNVDRKVDVRLYYFGLSLSSLPL